MLIEAVDESKKEIELLQERLSSLNEQLVEKEEMNKEFSVKLKGETHLSQLKSLYYIY